MRAIIKGTRVTKEQAARHASGKKIKAMKRSVPTEAKQTRMKGDK